MAVLCFFLEYFSIQRISGGKDILCGIQRMHTAAFAGFALAQLAGTVAPKAETKLSAAAGEHLQYTYALLFLLQ